MSSTRHAEAGAPISYERYMSSPEFAELRGISATAGAAKAQLCGNPRSRSLLFFLQSLSLRDGGLRQLTRALAKTLPSAPQTQLRHSLIELCINPKVVIQIAGEVPDENGSASPPAQFCQALLQFQDRYEARINADFVRTSIGQEIFATLDHALAIQKMIVIEGDSGTGKTTAAEAWCARHQGEVRFVTLSGITHKTGFFHKLAAAVGLAASKRKAVEMQIRIEEFFRRTRPMLVIDEAHYLFPQHLQRHASPELVDWVNTALVNQQVPVALICTDQFAKLKARVERRTGWTSEQLEHRVKRYKKLPATPTKQDLEAVATQLLAGGWNDQDQAWNSLGQEVPADFVHMIVGYALTCRMRLPAVADTIHEARYQARQNGRSIVTGVDIQKALLEYRIPTDGALQQAFPPRPTREALVGRTSRMRGHGRVAGWIN
jgi:hypothetical protein